MKEERILVVDDEAGMLRGVQRVLENQYRVETASSGSAALALAPRFEPHLAVLDVRMPEMDGFELMSRLRELLPDLDVIYMTGAVHEVDAQLIRAIRERAFYFIQKPFDRQVLLTLVTRCLDLRRLSAANEEHIARLKGELEEARRFQNSLMPGPEARIGRVDLAARCAPCDELGGDFYDWVDAGDGRSTVLICDVSGHGVSAAMMTGIVKSAFHDTANKQYRPDAVVTSVANAIRPFEDDRLVTLFCAQIASDGSLDYVNAGHPAPIIWGRERALETLTLTGPMLSPAFPDLGWECGQSKLSAGDRLLAYTDGLTEARRDDEFYGEERLFALAKESRTFGRSLIDTVFASVDAFTGDAAPDDDRTMLNLVLVD